MLDALRPIRVFNDVSRLAEAFFDVSAFELRFAEQVRAALRMDQRRARLECGLWRCHRFQHFVFDVDQLGRLASQPLGVSDNTGDDVATAAGLLADGNVDGPIFFDESDVAVARHISGRDDAVDAVERQRARWHQCGVP